MLEGRAPFSFRIVEAPWPVETLGPLHEEFVVQQISNMRAHRPERFADTPGWRGEYFPPPIAQERTKAKTLPLSQQKLGCIVQ